MLARTHNRPPWDVTALDQAFQLYRAHLPRYGRDVGVGVGMLVVYQLAVGAQAGWIPWDGLSPLSAGHIGHLLWLLRLGTPLGDALRLQLQPIAFCLVAAFLLTALIVHTTADLTSGAGQPSRSRGFAVALLPLILLLLPVLTIQGVLADLLREGAWMAAVSRDPKLALLDWQVELVSWAVLWLAPLGLVVTLGAGLLPALPIVVLEPVGPAAALRRSWQLSRGARLGIAAALMLVVSLTALFSALPDILLTMATRGELVEGAAATAATVTVQLIEALFFPLLPIMLTLIYLDRRNQAEGFDLEQRVAELAQAELAPLRQRAEALVKAGDFAAALPDLDRILELDPDDITARALRQTARTRTGDAVGAAADAEANLRHTPNLPHALGNRALAREAMGDHVGAAEDIAQALALRPSFPNELEYAATAHYNAGRLHESLGLLDLLHRFRPDDGWPLYNGACVMARLGRVEGALERLEQAIARDSTWAAQAQADDDFAGLRDAARFRAVVGQGDPAG